MQKSVQYRFEPIFTSQASTSKDSGCLKVWLDSACIMYAVMPTIVDRHQFVRNRLSHIQKMIPASLSIDDDAVKYLLAAEAIIQNEGVRYDP